jgi:hypothetical protein
MMLKIIPIMSVILSFFMLSPRFFDDILALFKLVSLLPPQLKKGRVFISINDWLQ